MNSKCCCGCCSLTTGTCFSLIIASIEAIIGIFVNAELFLLMSDSKTINPSLLVINTSSLDDFKVFKGLVLAALCLNGLWVVFAIFAGTGNSYQSHERLLPWIFHTYLISLFQFGLAVYFAVKFQDAFAEAQEFYKDSLPTKTMTYLTLLCIHSGGGLQIVFNLYLARVVERRAQEIVKDYSDLTLYILTYSRNPTTCDEMEQNCPNPPPGYDDTSCPPYLSPEIYQRANDSSGSSWSLSCDTLKGNATAELNSMPNVHSLRRNILTFEHLASMMSRNDTTRYERVDVETNSISALPY